MLRDEDGSRSAAPRRMPWTPCGKRGCTAVVRRTDPSNPSWTYVFGHLDPAADAQALVDGAKLFAGAADGLMPWRGRPDALKRGLIARVPPLDFTEQTE